MTYLDHAATTPVRPDVVEKMSQIMLEVVGNPSSIHQYGRRAHEYLENARQI
nr:aminotransferase class V-fold PLP-dependent enzyme [Enterococcus sp.]